MLFLLYSRNQRDRLTAAALSACSEKNSKQHSKIDFRNSYAYESSHDQMSNNTEQSIVIQALLRDQDRKA